MNIERADSFYPIGWSRLTTEVMISLQVRNALDFASCCHTGQIRKYTNQPYIVHPYTVAGDTHEFIVMNTDINLLNLINIVQAALLHDVVEDCNVSFNTIDFMFGQKVSEFVFWLTDVLKPEQGNRAMRKWLKAKQLAVAPDEVKYIKHFDLYNNAVSIAKHDQNFFVLFKHEANDLFEAMNLSCKDMFKQRIEELDPRNKQPD